MWTFVTFVKKRFKIDSLAEAPQQQLSSCYFAKVKNKLDGNLYALKRIKLNPSNLQLNKRMTREVKLLSRLNHENVVRYIVVIYFNQAPVKFFFLFFFTWQ